jgi:hypothetical protein
MPLIALASVKGSPGVTTTCLALAAAWPAQRRLIIEADPAGGDLGPWLGLPAAPGLTGLAAAARHDHSSDVAWQHACELGGGLHLVIAPAGADQASACLAALAQNADTIFTSLAAGPDTVIADLGRLDPGSAALPIAARADITLLMVRPRVSDLSNLALRADGLSRAGAHLALLPGPRRRPRARRGQLPGQRDRGHPGHPGAGQLARRPARRGGPDRLPRRGAQDPAGAAGPRSSQPRRRAGRRTRPARAVPGRRGRPRSERGASSSRGDRR